MLNTSNFQFFLNPNRLVPQNFRSYRCHPVTIPNFLQCVPTRHEITNKAQVNQIANINFSELIIYDVVFENPSRLGANKHTTPHYTGSRNPHRRIGLFVCFRARDRRTLTSGPQSYFYIDGISTVRQIHRRIPS